MVTTIQVWDSQGFMFCEHRVTSLNRLESLLKRYNDMPNVTAKLKPIEEHTQ